MAHYDFDMPVSEEKVRGLREAVAPGRRFTDKTQTPGPGVLAVATHYRSSGCFRGTPAQVDVTGEQS